VLGDDRPALVDRLAEQVEHRPSVSLPTGTDRRAGVEHVIPRLQPVGAAEGDRPHAAAAEVLLHLAGEVHAVAFDADGVVNARELVLGELGVERRADDLCDLPVP
jgi:hypothetical protein